MPKKSKHKFPNAIGVKWTEKYSKQLEYVWCKLPTFLAKFILTAAICALALAINGEWIHVAVHTAKQFGYMSRQAIANGATFQWSEISLESLRLQNLETFVFFSSLVSYLIYFIIGGFLHWYFYVRQRNRPEEWKCQPKKWLSPELERQEIILGSCTLFVNSTLSALVSCYISNGGYTTLYYNPLDYSIWWLLLQIPALFIYQEYSTYLLHRLYHTPLLYKNFHKLHHRYKQPTAFSVTALHPVEAMHIHLHYLLPLFVIPLHWVVYYSLQLYIYYHGIIDHSGVNFKAHWWQPWQPDAIFHDNHHQYFHVNFGFNSFIWDKLHGTYRRRDRIYSENIFYGRGKALAEATEEELKADIDERLSENPLAYREKALIYKLAEEDLGGTRKNRRKNNNVY